MKLSIIIPTYNSASVLSRALDSIVCQSFTDWEILIMDGVSNDDTLKVAQSYNDSRIRIYSEPDNGIYDAMNKGINKANGEWLYFLGSDDWLVDNEVLANVNHQLYLDMDIFYGDVDAPHLPPRHKGEWMIEDIECNRCHQAIFYNKSFFKRYGCYNTKYIALADYDVNLRWRLNKKIKSYYSPIIIAHYSNGGFSEIADDKSFFEDQPRNILRYNKHILSQDQKNKYIDIINQRKRFKRKYRKDQLFLKIKIIFHF